MFHLSILNWAVFGSWSTLLGCWALYVAQYPLPATLSLCIAIATLLTSSAALLAHGHHLWTRGDRKRLVAMSCLIVLAGGLYLPGINHEVGDNYYHDEGTYRSNADDINRGNFLRQTFSYPHLLYYADAFATWVASLFHPSILLVSQQLWGVSDWSVFCRLLARLLTALAGALTVIPAFLLGERLAGLGSGVMAGLLTMAASQYHEGSNLHTCDIPSAFFAMCCLATVGGISERETIRGYCLAGVWAGLAAGSKYPAGVVALAILFIYLKWRIRERTWSWGLPAATATAISTFLATTPSLVAYYEFSIFGPMGALFGWRQYTQGQWLGVVANSNSAYYFDLIRASFGWPALLLGGIGLLFTNSKRRLALLWLLPYPLGYLATMIGMSIVVERNLYPALPPIATFLGVGIWTLSERFRKTSGGRQFAAPLVLLVSLSVPLINVVLQEVSFRRDSTRQLASHWIYYNLPHGSRILKERYTPNIHPESFEVGKTRWLGSYSVDELRGYDLDYVVLSHAAYSRFLDPEQHFEAYQKVVDRNYREIFERLELTKSFEPGPVRRGPVIRIYRVGASEPSSSE